MTQKRVLAQAKSVIVGVVCYSHVGCAQFAGEERLAFGICLSALAGIVVDRPVPFMEKVFIVTTRTKGLAREVKNLGSKAKSNILPARRVVSDERVEPWPVSRRA